MHLAADILEPSEWLINSFLRTGGEKGSALVNLHVMILELGQSIFLLSLWKVDGHDDAVLQKHVAYVVRGVSRTSPASLAADQHASTTETC